MHMAIRLMNGCCHKAKEIPQQRCLSKKIDIEAKLKTAAQILGCDLEGFQQMQRVTKFF
jgi:hypothetical protein